MVQSEAPAGARLDEQGSPGFDRMAHQYDQSRGEYPTELVHQGLRIVYGDQYDALKGKKILDAGAGTGQISYAYLTLGADVTGIDISPAMLEIAKKRCEEFPDYTALVGDLTKLPFEDNSFDFITSRWVMEFIPDWPKAIRELKRVLKPGGTLLLIQTHNMLRTTPRTMFEQIARKRGAPVGFPGATHRLLWAYLHSQGAVVEDYMPEELFWEREMPVERTLWEFHSRMINHLYKIPDDEYELILKQVEDAIGEQYPDGLVDRPTVVTQFWHVKFSGEPSFVQGLKFKVLSTISKTKRFAPRYFRRAFFKATTLFGAK